MIRRFRLLIFFGAGLLGIAAINALQSYEALSFVQQVLFSRFTHFNLVLLLGTLALLEYKTQKRMIDQAPVSLYHRRPQLPESITGAVLVIDLKNSEALFRMGAERGHSGWLVETCLSHMWTAATNEGGVILQTEGDQIRPVWQEMSNSRLAAWVEVGSQHPLLESVRMMELEKELPKGAGGSLVLMSEEAAIAIENQMKGLSGEWDARQVNLVGKHLRRYQVAAYRPLPARDEPNPLLYGELGIR